MDVLTIGQVAKRTGVGVETLRYYEREGLVQDGCGALERRKQELKVVG